MLPCIMSCEAVCASSEVAQEGAGDAAKHVLGLEEAPKTQPEVLG